MARPGRRNSSIQFGDMPVRSFTDKSLRPDPFNWADEVDEEEKQEQDRDSSVQHNLATLETEMTPPKGDAVEDPEQADVPILQEHPATFEAETDRPMEEDTERLDQAGTYDLQDDSTNLEAHIAALVKDTVVDPEHTEDAVVQDTIVTPGLEVAIQEDLMEGVEDKPVTPETQSVGGLEIEDDLDIAENVQDDIEHPEDIATTEFVPTKEDEDDDTVRECSTLEPGEFNVQDDPKTLEAEMNTAEEVDSKPTVPVMTYAKIAAAGAAMSPEPVSISSAAGKNIEKTPYKTPTKARATPVRGAQNSTRITPVVPKSFERNTSGRKLLFVDHAAGHVAATPADPGREAVTTEAQEKQEQWTVVSTPRKTRKTPLTTPVQSAQQPSSNSAQPASGNGDKEDDDEEDTNTLASPSPAVPDTPTKTKSKPNSNARRRAKIKAAKAAKAAQAQAQDQAQAVALATASAPVVETEAEATGLEGKVEVEEVMKSEQVSGLADAGSIEAPEVQSEKPETKAIVETAGLDVVDIKKEIGDPSEVDMEVEVKEEVEVTELSKNEAVQPATGRSSIALFILMLLVAWVVYSVICYMPDIFEYLKELLRSDVPDL